jgi:hypothetical protein
MKIVFYLHVNSKENNSDCLTKHLAHPQLWALIKEHLFYCWNENGKHEILHFLTDGSAPDGKCQAGNRIGGPEQTLPVYDASWHPVFYNGQWYLVPPDAYGPLGYNARGHLPMDKFL